MNRFDELQAQIDAMQAELADLRKRDVEPQLAVIAPVLEESPEASEYRSLFDYYEWAATLGGREPEVFDPGSSSGDQCIRLALDDGRTIVFKGGIEGPLDAAAQAAYCTSGYQDVVPTLDQQRRFRRRYDAGLACGVTVPADAPSGDYFSCIGQELLRTGL